MMRSCVSVPVLSVHSTSMAPKFWIELRRLTMTLRRDIASAPLARLTVTIIGSISGVRPTATATANSSASSQLPLVRPLITNTSGAITTMNPSISQVNRLMPLSKLVSTRCLAIALATRPNAVRGPVSTTTPQPMPLTTALPMKQMLARSNGVSAAPGWAAATFSSGIASPVSAAWLTKRSFAEISLRSAGIMSPADNRTMSPGTSCSIGTSMWSCASPAPRRRTVAVIDTIRCSLSAALLERCSWMKLSEMLKITMTAITIAAR